ncbi:hypothetical protein AO368_0013 [Moraxella catarrhalis]|nr:hypothetical protein AO368_0013 [Moraxella catarrhalis]
MRWHSIGELDFGMDGGFCGYFSTVNQQRWLKLEKLQVDWCWVF